MTQQWATAQAAGIGSLRQCRTLTLRSPTPTSWAVKVNVLWRRPGRCTTRRTFRCWCIAGIRS